MVKKEHISLLKENEQVMMTLHRHWIILIFHFLYFLALFISTWVLISYRIAIMDIIGGSLYW